jgi:hypothetical protein
MPDGAAALKLFVNGYSPTKSLAGSLDDARRKQLKPDFIALHQRHRNVAGRDTITGRVVADGRVVQIVDAAADPEYTPTQITTLAKIRTLLGVRAPDARRRRKNAGRERFF